MIPVDKYYYSHSGLGAGKPVKLLHAQNPWYPDERLGACGEKRSLKATVLIPNGVHRQCSRCTKALEEFAKEQEGTS